MNNQHIVYHCSPDRIEKFCFKHGVHFGGKTSALEAGFRKLKNLNLKQTIQQCNTYLHVCYLTIPNNVYDCLDVGNYEDWLKEIKQATEDGYSLIRYVNKYEPDSVPSYIVLDENLLSIKFIEILALHKYREFYD